MNSEKSLVSWCIKNDIFGGAETAVIDLLQRRSNVSDENVLLAAGLAIWAHRHGHPCVYLDALERQISGEFVDEAKGSVPPRFPTSSALSAALRSSPEVVRVVESAHLGTYHSAVADMRPLVLLNNLLFTQRQFADELSIAEQLAARAKRSTNTKVDL